MVVVATAGTLRHSTNHRIFSSIQYHARVERRVIVTTLEWYLDNSCKHICLPLTDNVLFCFRKTVGVSLAHSGVRCFMPLNKGCCTLFVVLRVSLCFRPTHTSKGVGL